MHFVWMAHRFWAILWPNGKRGTYVWGVLYCLKLTDLAEGYYPQLVLPGPLWYTSLQEILLWGLAFHCWPKFPLGWLLPSDINVPTSAAIRANCWVGMILETSLSLLTFSPSPFFSPPHLGRGASAVVCICATVCICTAVGAFSAACSSDCTSSIWACSFDLILWGSP